MTPSPLAAVSPLREVLRLASRRAARARRAATAADVFAVLRQVDDPVAVGVVAAFPQLAAEQPVVVPDEQTRRVPLVRRRRASAAVNASASAALLAATSGGNPLRDALRRLAAADEGGAALQALAIDPIAWDRTLDRLP